ncbi:MAG: aminotransferase class III-fold pyridoxal phosphate-dependent enzyme [Candidatus Micrarchaeota archaeon]
MTKGTELWTRAKQIIPGGSQLLSKRSEMFLPDQWPSYYSKAKGIELWDLDGTKFIDFCIMGIGANILGYADKDVNKAVIERIKNANMATLNCPEEVELAEKLLKMNQWAGMVRYARTGGESMSVAVRIARAYSKKSKVAFSGYHGWHDWYLATNLLDSTGLNDHLLKGLEPNGVPKTLSGTTIPFHHGKLEELQTIADKHKDDLGVIVLEVQRSKKPDVSFLQGVRKIADETGAVLVFDEISSGFRNTVGGVYKEFRVNPDIIVFGKAMSNGFPMGAIVGKKEVMDSAQTSFISSTYWTEGIGPTAALATIKKMEEKNAPAHITKIGIKTGKIWEKLGKEHGLKMHVDFDFPPIMHFGFDYENAQAVRTLFTQEMLKGGYLASGGFYVSYAHKTKDVEAYADKVNEVFALLKSAIEKNEVEKMLNGPIAHSGFQRLTN